MKPKVLIVNKFYYPRGGDCTVAMQLEQLLTAAGCKTAIYAMQYPENVETAWNSYFASRVDFGAGAAGKLRAVLRILGLGDIRRSFRRILDDFRPDVVHLHNIHSYLSPVLASIAHRRGIRVVWTLHDYKLVCPSYSCLADGKPCTDCIGNPRAILGKKCMKGSAAASALAWLEARRWNRRTLQNNVDVFVCPSAFMRQMMMRGGFDPGRLQIVSNCANADAIAAITAQFAAEAAGNQSAGRPARQDYYCYIGRLSAEKGVEYLLQAASALPYKLKVAGDGPLGAQLREKYASAPNIEFVGKLDAAGVNALLASARLSVIPSAWYENNPMSVIESLCQGTPVVGTEIGGIPELIQTEGDESIAANGIVVAPFDADALAKGIEQAWNTASDHAAISARACRIFSPRRHLSAMLALYHS